MQDIEKISSAPCPLRNPSSSSHSGRTVAVTIGSGLRYTVSRESPRCTRDFALTHLNAKTTFFLTTPTTS
jgi:hypothetical protein